MLNLGRVVVLVVLAGVLAACSSSSAGALPGGVSANLIQAVRSPHAVVYTFRVKNDGDAAVRQAMVRSYCMVRTPGNLDIAAHSTNDVSIEVDQDPKCRVASSLTEGYTLPGGPADRRAEFTFDYVRSNSGFGKPFVGVFARGWNGLCAIPVRDEPANLVGINLSQGNAPSPGCYTVPAIAAAAAKPFTFKIENLTTVSFSARNVFSACIEGTPAGQVPTGTVTAFSMQTTEGAWCRFGAEFTTELTIPDGSKRTVAGVISWTYQDPSTIRVVAEGSHLYCAVKVDNERVKFYKTGPPHC